MLARPVACGFAAADEDTDGYMVRGPHVHLPQHVHKLDTRGMERQLVPAVSPFAEAAGYSRVVRVGQHVFVAGTAVGGTQDKYLLFIENCHVHVERIVNALVGAAPPPAPAPLAQPES